MSALRTAIPQHLRTFVEPQIEQLSLRMESVRCGLYATLPKSLGEGFLWTAALGEECLVSMHSIRLKKPLILEERPTDFFCVFSGSSATLRSLPNAHTEATAERENVLSFSQTGGTTRCLMRAGDLYESTSITYTPGYFESLRKSFPDDFGDAEATMRALGSAGPPAEVRAILRSFTPERASLPGAAPYFHAKALETATALLTRSRTWTENEAERTDRAIVEQAEKIISARFSEGLTVKAIADELFVSRSRLYDAFRNVRGMGVAERLRAERMGAACSLLGSGETDVARVARAVGYARTSAFDEAFRRTFGCSPTQWRRRPGRSQIEPFRPAGRAAF